MLDCRQINFRTSGSISRYFIQSTSGEAGVIKWAPFLQCPPPKICDGKKIVQIFHNFWLLSTLIANLRKGSTHQKSEKLLIIHNLSTLGQENLAYFGPQTRKLLTLINVHPNVIFSGNYSSALRGCCAMKFLYSLQIDQGYLALTTTGTGVPLKKF